MTTGELDLKKRVWTIPAGRAKNKREHSVPLSDLAVALIKEALADAIDDRVFRLPEHRVNKYVSNYKRKFPVTGWTAHDLRRTCCTKMVELGVSPLTVGHIANHLSTTKAGMTLGVYVQYSFDKEKREALELWANRLAAIVSGGAAKVIPMRAHE